MLASRGLLDNQLHERLVSGVLRQNCLQDFAGNIALLDVPRVHEDAYAPVLDEQIAQLKVSTSMQLSVQQ